MVIIALAAIVALIVAIVRSKAKQHASRFIFSWTVGLAVGVALIVYFAASTIRAGNPGAVAGDISGPTLTITLLVTSIKQITMDNRRQRL
jgi:hypothetical protein